MTNDPFYSEPALKLRFLKASFLQTAAVFFAIGMTLARCTVGGGDGGSGGSGGEQVSDNSKVQQSLRKDYRRDPEGFKKY